MEIFAITVHNWVRVDANLFHDFHQTWIINIRNALNGGLLPKGYSALVEQHAGGVVPDLNGLPQSKYVIHSEAELFAARGNRITIRHPLGRVVCVIEIVSPGNKNSRLALRSFVEKTVDLLHHGIHILVIDLFPPSERSYEPALATRTVQVNGKSAAKGIGSLGKRLLK